MENLRAVKISLKFNLQQCDDSLHWAGPYEHSKIDGYFPHSLFLSQCLCVIPRFLFFTVTPSFPVPNTNFQAFAVMEGAKPLFVSGRRFKVWLILDIFAQ